MSDPSVITNESPSTRAKSKRFRYLDQLPGRFLVDQTERRLLSKSESRLATAIGLAMGGLGKSSINIDHLAETQPATKKLSRWLKAPPKNRCWGLDIGSDSLKAVHLSLMDQGKRIALEEAYCIRYSQDIILDPQLKRERIAKTLAAFAEKHSLSKSAVCVGLSSDDCLFSSLNLPAIDKKRTEAAVYHEVKYHLPATDYLYLWTYGITGRFCTPEGNWCQTVLVSLVRQELIRNFLKVLAECSIEPKLLIPNAVANLNYLLKKKSPKLEDSSKQESHLLSFDSTDGYAAFPPFAVVDMGATSTEVSIFSLPKIMIGIDPVGGNTFTEKICRAKRLVWKEGETLKRASMEQSAVMKLAGIWQEVGVHLCHQIQQRCHQFEMQAEPIESIYLSGGASQLKGILSLFQFLDRS
jgi:Tfp pilus assembly PilM family ATPase